MFFFPECEIVQESGYQEVGVIHPLLKMHNFFYQKIHFASQNTAYFFGIPVKFDQF
jgi:hypothetical protein